MSTIRIPTSNPLQITAEQADEIIRNEATRKGWVRPELSQSQNPEVVEVLNSLRSTRESLGDTVNVYVTPGSLAR
jgi:ribosome-binding protein aMBF1 (putative translation factor)